MEKADIKETFTPFVLWKFALSILISVFFILLLLTDPVNSKTLVLSGLSNWYGKMIPSLFPFMVLSGVLLRTGLSRTLSGILYPVFGFLFRLSPDCVYVIIMGFLCGFPMGANIVSESLSLHKISEREGKLLLSFCNNIGPAYFLSFVSICCPYGPIFLTFTLMYLVPFLYGLFLRYTHYRDIPFYSSKNIVKAKDRVNNGSPSAFGKSNTFLGTALQESLEKAISSILTLGGCMVIFTVIQLPLYNTYYKIPVPYLYLLKGLLEITSGVTAIQSLPSLYGIVYMLFLPLGGLCCFYQTYTMIKDTSLSMSSYLFHKINQTFITIILYHILYII